MLGRIFDQGSLAVIYSPIIKTSNTGLFGNRRLAILSFRQAILGYQSKLPDNFDTFQDINCAQSCKEILNIKKQSTITYYLSPSDQSTLVLKWQAEKQKIWEFKFQNAEISNQWFRYISKIINPTVLASPSPTKQIEEDSKNLNFSKIKQASRFSKNQPHQNENINPSMCLSPNQKKEGNKQFFISQQKSKIIEDQDSQPDYRFKQFQRENNLAYESVNRTTPIITTFRQRFPSNTIFASVKRQSSSESEADIAQNWNMIWYQAIQTEQEHVRIDIYRSFLRTCQNTCKEIIKQLAMLKHYRRLFPAKISANEEIYNCKNITYHLIIEKDIENSETQLCSNYLLQEFKKLQENYTFILKATKNKGLIKVPLSCIFQYRGFTFYCEADIPSHFLEVDHSEKYIFHPQLLRLEQHLRIKINLSHINLFTNKLSSIVELPLKRNHYLIIKDIKKILPEANLQGSVSFVLSKQFFLQSNDIYPKDYDYSQQKLKLQAKFLKAQNTTCTIISYQDLKQSLQISCLTFSSLPQLILVCQNKYLTRIFVTEFVSESFCHIVRTEMMIFIKKWNKDLEAMMDEVPDYEIYIFQLLSEFLSENISTNVRIWNIISNQIFSKLSITIKMDEIIIGYLLSSISLKLGINLDYQLLILQKDHFFNEGILIPTQSLKSFEPIFTKFTDEDMCDSFEVMLREIQNHEDQNTLMNVTRFYRFKQQNFQHQIDPYHWKKICKLFSFYVPYDNEQEFAYLSIYSSLNLLYLDYNSFCILVSAIKWLFHSKRVDDALQFVYFFKDVSWFWVSEGSPFTIVLLQIVGEYFRITGNLLSSIEYFSKCNSQFQKMVKGNVELDNLNRNLKLAQIYMTCNMHKQSLKKYLEVKKILRKTDKDTMTILDVLVQISKLYLHLGDIENCSRTCKETVQFSSFHPFQNEEQEYQIYSVLLRSFEIKEDYSKYKFYVDIIEQKFKYTKHPIILQNILRLTIEQIIQKYNRYHLKKIAFVLYNFQKKSLSTDEELSLAQLFRRLIKQVGVEQPCKILRYCMENHVEISDLLISRQAGGETIQNHEEIMRMQNLLKILCSFIGFEFIFAQIVTNLKK